jgi:uncharacterized membrane protein SirB2
MSYLLLKHLHISLAALSGALFMLRAAWMLADSPRLQHPWVRRVPHMADSLLLATALALAFWSGQTPANSPWLAAKLVALVAYIVLGAIALRYGRTKALRCAALAGALACFGYIVVTARTKNPIFFL